MSELCDEFRLVPGEKPFVLAGCVGSYVGYDLLHTMGIGDLTESLRLVSLDDGYIGGCSTVPYCKSICSYWL